jgi:hypothetical protein
LIEPHCLVGDKAWKRWKLWRYRLKKTLGKIPTADDIGIYSKTPKIIAELNSDFKFIAKMNCDKFDNMKIKKIDIVRWLNSGELSFYYAVLSPWIRKIFSIEDLNFDQVYYRSSINPEIEKFFKEKFYYEF